MDARDRQAFPLFICLFAILFGITVRLVPAILISAPINDGGMFYQAVLDLQANSYRLPFSLSYNHLNIPFAYPPLGFYLTGFLQILTRSKLYSIFQYWPGFASTFSIPAFYFLAKAILKDKMRAAIASVFYATAPASFYLPFMGGGIARAPALAFSLLALGYLYRMFECSSWRYSLPAAAFLALTALTHPETIFHTLFSGILFWWIVGRKRENLRWVLIVAAGVLILTAPWWILMLQRYGPAPYLNAVSSSLRDNFAFLYLLQFNLTGEPFLTVIGVLSAIGTILAIKRRDWLLPIWILLSFITSLRASPFSAIFPVAMLAVVGLERLVGETPEAFGSLLTSAAKRNITLVLFAYNLMSGLWAGTGVAYEQRLTADERAFLARVASLTPPDSRFLIVSGASAPSDALAEWFPALTQRVSVATVQGHEWTRQPNVTEAFWEAADLQTCVDMRVDCLQAWSQKYNRPYDYVYIRRIRTLRTGGLQSVHTVLEMSLRASGDYRLVQDSDVGAFFKWR